MKQIILINNCDFREYERIKEEIETGLKSGQDRFTVCGSIGQIVEIEVIELPDTTEPPTIINNTHIGMSKLELVDAVNELIVAKVEK